MIPFPSNMLVIADYENFNFTERLSRKFDLVLSCGDVQFRERLKPKRDISGFDEKIISMYAKGMTTQDIQVHIKDLYNYDISLDTVKKLNLI